MSSKGNDDDYYVERKLSSDFTLHSPREGFFKDYLDEIDFQLPQEFIDGFGKFKTDEERFSRMWEFKPIHKLRIRSSYKKKNKEKSEALRNEGNKAFKDHKNDEALKFYSGAVLLAPHGDESLSLGYANRSAVFFHQNEYQRCLNDIELAVEAQYPERLMYKILDRQGQCLKSLGLYEQATETFSNAVKALGASEMGGKKLQTWKRYLNEKIQHCTGKTDCKENETPLTRATLYAYSNPAIPSASSAITVHQSNEQGRYAVAKDSVPTGQVLIAETPYATAMEASKTSYLCYNCFKRLVAPVACRWCSGISFCSIGCRDLALANHHKWECKFLDFLYESGMSINCFLALRIITQHGLSFFQNIRSRLQEPARLPSLEFPHLANDYLSVYRMVGLEEKRPQNSFIPLAVMACFLIKVLQRAHFFGTKEEIGSHKNRLSEEEAFIGGLLLRHLQVVQFNAHEVSGMEFNSEECRFQESKSVFLGIGIYPTAAFCNHSCYPSVTRYFEGTKLIVVSLRPLEPGDVIAENYGPIFTKHSLQERQRKLMSRYWFRCTCEACLGNWPVYEEMIYSRELRCQKCSSTLPSMTPNESHVNCIECGTSYNVVSALKKLDQADQFYDKGKKHLEERRIEEAIQSFISYIEIVYKLVTLPMFELFVAFDGLRIMFAAKSTIQLIKK